MKKAIVISFYYARIIIILFLIIITLSNASADAIRVGSRQQIKSITKAIETAKSGDTIFVSEGIYREGNIIIEKSITMIGEKNPILDGENKYEILTLHGKNITISGFKFINTGIASIKDIAAIKILESSRINILHNTFNNAFFGIYLASSSDCLIENNLLEADVNAEHQIGNGIHLWKCTRMSIRKNKIKGQRDGIYFEFVTNSEITENYSEGNLRYGLHFMFSNDDIYQYNTFINNGAGVAVMYTKGVTMFNNIFEHNWGSSAYGLLLKDIRDSKIQNNKFIENSVGVFMEGSSRNEIHENEFSKNGYAIRLQASCDDNKIERNNFRQNTFDLVTNGNIVLNKIDANYWDKYEGYDLNKDKVGDVPYRPISLYGTVVERMPTAILLWRSFFVFLLDRAEKAVPVITPENLIDNTPAMLPHDFDKKY
ncbi:MAG: nitrous oxide reductase family maturation protein NosD [Chitinophagaceae bacterium]|nr:nitrous oxide reductase family maturation protein NosD [Chitinophagaceae bacterium]